MPGVRSLGVATQGVAGDGPATARMMLVGEQPGDEEDQRRRAVRRSRRDGSSTGPGRCRHRPGRDLRHQRGEALQVGAARQAPHPPATERARGRRLPAVARCGDRRPPRPRGDRAPRRDRRECAVRVGVPGRDRPLQRSRPRRSPRGRHDPPLGGPPVHANRRAARTTTGASSRISAAPLCCCREPADAWPVERRGNGQPVATHDDHRSGGRPDRCRARPFRRVGAPCSTHDVRLTNRVFRPDRPCSSGEPRPSSWRH